MQVIEKAKVYDGFCVVHFGSFTVQGYAPVEQERLLSARICMNCDSWLTHWKDRDEPNVVRINGQHYRIGDPKSDIKGFAGRGVRIKFFDGREVITDNLWHQGEIPELWRDWLFDNAIFGDVVTKEELREL